MGMNLETGENGGSKRGKNVLPMFKLLLPLLVLRSGFMAHKLPVKKRGRSMKEEGTRDEEGDDQDH